MVRQQPVVDWPAANGQKDRSQKVKRKIFSEVFIYCLAEQVFGCAVAEKNNLVNLVGNFRERV